MPGEPPDLAIHGGPPAVTVGPFEWPPADGAIRDAIADAVESGEWGRYHGAPCARLVERLAREFAASHVQLTCSGTIAVEVALHAVGVGPGDEVILAGYDFPGNFRAIESLGARPVLVDVAAQDWVIDLDKLEQNTADLRAARAVVVSHLHGRLLDMPRLMALAVEHGWAVVEDACQCPGAEIAGRPAGSWGDAGVLSFGGSKLLTAGRGGALLTNGAGVAQRAKVYTNRGNDAFAMSNLQAAALLPQLDSLAQHTATRAEAAAAVFEATAGEPSLGRPTPAESPGLPAYYKLAWRLRPERLRSTREEVVGALQAERAPIDTGFRGFTKRSARRCRVVGDLVNSAAAGEETLLLHHPALLGPPRAATQLAAALAKVLRHFGAGARGKT